MDIFQKFKDTFTGEYVFGGEKLYYDFQTPRMNAQKKLKCD
ncbi:hypothetical protein LCGC14_2986540 [marine sediment metagenome]|uniref:Uncharacterized protein n=1 Tax=marine sediment metagenome TaxID=412755 RepID=A0A0F8X514_9ZZZZ